MKLLDRMILRSFLKAWLIFFTSLMSLFIVVDAFSRLDDYVVAAGANNWKALLALMAERYRLQAILIFDRIGGALTLLAALFTLAWMQKSNEIVPLLASGVPLRRLLRPVFLGALVFTGLAAANREFILPEAAEALQNPPSDPQGRRLRPVAGMYDSSGILIEGFAAQPSEKAVLQFTCTLPPRFTGTLLHVRAKAAYWIPPGQGPYSGGWLLTDAQPAELPPLSEPGLTMIDPGKHFLKTERVDFDLLVRTGRWQEAAPFWELQQELNRGEASNLAALSMELHSRLLGPAVTLVGLALGVALLMRQQSRNVYVNLAFCLGMAACLFFAGMGAKRLAEQELIEPVLAAWLPLLAFGPLAAALWDAMQG